MAKVNRTILIILAVYTAIAVAFWYFSDQIGVWALTANPFIVTLANLVTNPFYLGSIILIIELFFRGYKLHRSFFNYARVIVASIFLSLSLDIVSILHSFSANFTVTDGSAISLYFDTVLGNIIKPYFTSPIFGTFVLYVIIPVLMALIALFIASPSRFLGIVKSEIGINNN
jgi:hypothetical protein